MITHVQFKSTAFPKYENENSEIVNPNRWGKRLAEFVRDVLPSYGVATENIRCEDWGWLVNTAHDEFPVWIGCGPVDEFSDSNGHPELPNKPGGDSLGMTEFCLFVTAEPSFFTKLFKRIDATQAVSKVVAGIEKMVADRAEFQDPEWSE